MKLKNLIIAVLLGLSAISITAMQQQDIAKYIETYKQQLDKSPQSGVVQKIKSLLNALNSSSPNYVQNAHVALLQVYTLASQNPHTPIAKWSINEPALQVISFDITTLQGTTSYVLALIQKTEENLSSSKQIPAIAAPVVKQPVATPIVRQQPARQQQITPKQVVPARIMPTPQQPIVKAQPAPVAAPARAQAPRMICKDGVCKLARPVSPEVQALIQSRQKAAASVCSGGQCRRPDQIQEVPEWIRERQRAGAGKCAGGKCGLPRKQ